MTDQRDRPSVASADSEQSAYRLPSDAEALQLADNDDLLALMGQAQQLRDIGFRNVITYSRKVFIPLTQLCRDVCHYCTFAQVPRKLDKVFMSPDEVVAVAAEGAKMGCKEALFTLGEKPELRYRAAREALAELGFDSTLAYLAHVAKRVLDETGLLPHLNPGTMTPAELAELRPLSPSMGIMLESASERLTEKGMPHYGSPDKVPAVRLQTLADAGVAQIPFTTGILIGIGETRQERVESLLSIRAIHLEHGHVQEIIVQNFRAKPETLMANAPEPDLEELLWTIAVARIIFGPYMSIQAPPNLSPGVLPKIVDSGINDWGGVSPLTPDYVNPEAPWPHLENLARETAVAGKHLDERLTIYPKYAQDMARWLDPSLHQNVLRKMDGEGFAHTGAWSPGEVEPPPQEDLDRLYKTGHLNISSDIAAILAKVQQRSEALRESGGAQHQSGPLGSNAADLSHAEIERLFEARGDDFTAVCRAADELRREVNGDTVSYVVNRNINYTNVCYFKCQFCAFSKGKLSENLRGRPYDLDPEEVQRRVKEAWDRGGTEVCMQGGIHPEYTGQTYIDIVKTVKEAVPEMHVHAFSPLEVWQGAATLGIDLKTFLQQLQDAGLGTLPGTAAEVLDDEVRAILCPDKINTEQWLEVMRNAHDVGFNTTATIMYGHVDTPVNWARHLVRVRDLQQETGGFTEFVPLPFVHMEAPLYLKGRARRGPTFREALLMHAVSRLTLYPYIGNIQASWVKMGHDGAVACLNAGCNDLGGTLMNETITRAAGAAHGQETSPQHMRHLVSAAGPAVPGGNEQRLPRQRSTDYGEVSETLIERGMAAGELEDVVNTPAGRKYERDENGRKVAKPELVRPGLIGAVNL